MASLAIICLTPGSSIAYTGLYKLMWAVTPTDMDVENNADEIAVGLSYEDCREMLGTYITEYHMWCEPDYYDIKPLDLSQY